jgi:hypothetical protein
MFTRRLLLAALTSASALAVPGIALARGKRHVNGHAMLGAKLKQNGKHNLGKAGKADVSVDVSNGKVVGFTAADPTRGSLAIKKFKTSKKLAGAVPDIELTGGPGTQYAQAGGGGYYGYSFDDGTNDWYYWFPAEVVIVDTTWVEYTG